MSRAMILPSLCASSVKWAPSYFLPQRTSSEQQMSRDTGSAGEEQAGQPGRPCWLPRPRKSGRGQADLPAQPPASEPTMHFCILGSPGQQPSDLSPRPPGPHTSLPPAARCLGLGVSVGPASGCLSPGSAPAAHTPPFPLSPTELPPLPSTPHLPGSSRWSEFPVGMGLPAEPPTVSTVLSQGSRTFFMNAERGLCRMLPPLLNVTCPPSVPTPPSR